jgi:hypothetical protein
MTDRITGVVVRTTQVTEENKNLLYALRHVLHVSNANFGYVVVLEFPVREDDMELFVRACRSFDFVQDGDDIELLKFTSGHLIADVTVKSKIAEFLQNGFPTLAEFDFDVAQFASQFRAWQKLAKAVHDII